MEEPIYLYTGPEFGERNDAVSAIKASLKKKLGEIDEHLFYLMETPLAQAMTILESGTLFSSGVCVVCKNAELIKKKDEIEMISSWLKSKPDESSTLILVSDEISVDSKLDKLVPAQNKKKFWEMFDDKKVPWLKDFFAKNGYRIEETAAELILDMVENNTQSLKTECSRFFVCYPKEHLITADDVDAILTHTREENAFSLFNKISDSSVDCQKRFEDGIEILQKIRLSKENSSVMIIAGLASCFRKLVTWHKINNNGYYADEMTMRTNGFASKLMQKQYRNAAKVWTSGQATAILADLASTDMEIRSGGTAMEEVILQKLLYEIIVKKGAQLSVYENSWN